MHSRVVDALSLRIEEEMAAWMKEPESSPLVVFAGLLVTALVVLLSTLV
jgi:hypothetical protein